MNSFIGRNFESSTAAKATLERELGASFGGARAESSLFDKPRIGGRSFHDPGVPFEE
jgi:hypothetical protein